MNIGNAINENVYKRVWECVWSECRQTMVDQITQFTHLISYDSLGSLVDDTLKGSIGLDLIAVMRKEL